MPSSSVSILTCIDSSCEDLFSCIYNLSSSDIHILSILLRTKKHSELTLEMLAKQVSRDKGTIFRSLQRLVGLGFATKQTKILKEGGYYHVYKAVDIETIEKCVDQRISEIQDALSRIRKSFRSDIKKMLAPKAP